MRRDRKSNDSQKCQWQLPWVSDNLYDLYRIAYIEFADKESSLKAKHLNESLFKGRQLTVEPKRKNVPGRGRGSAIGFNPRGAQNPLNMFLGML